MNRQVNFYIKKIVEREYLNRKVVEAEVDQYEIPFPILPTKGDHSIDSCRDCFNLHKSIMDEVNLKFSEFPNC